MGGKCGQAFAQCLLVFENNIPGTASDLDCGITHRRESPERPAEPASQPG